MSNLLKALRIDELEKAVQKLEKQVESLPKGSVNAQVEHLTLELKREKNKRQSVTKILDETIDKVEKMVQVGL